MKSTSATLKRHDTCFGWANRLLRIDLSSHSISSEPIEHYLPDFIGGRGLAARLAWTDWPVPIEPFSPDNPLILMTGPLTGTRAPTSGRMAVCGFGPQTWPYGWFTRSNIGGFWGAALKRAGYDGVIVTGASDGPVHIVIHDDEVEIAPADHLWGLDTYETQDAIRDEYRGVRSLVIGPAGERLSRIACILTETSSAAGEGGFGAVMGAKKLKAVSVAGTGQVSVAHPERFRELVRSVNQELRKTWRGHRNTEKLNAKLQSQRGGTARPYACTAACPTPCTDFYRDLPGVAHRECLYDGHVFCVGVLLQGVADTGPLSHGGYYDFQLGTYGGVEMSVLSNRYGLNHWDLLIGMVPWLERCQLEGRVSELNGVAMNWQDARFWDTFLRSVAYREGVGDALAEGGWRAASILGLGEDLMGRHYVGWGSAGHWDGHACWDTPIVFPYWLVSALQWATDVRDPYGSSKGYVQHVMAQSPMAEHWHGGKGMTWEEMRMISQSLYGTAHSFEPDSGYSHKAYPAFYHNKRGVLKDSLTCDDISFPLIYGSDRDGHVLRVGDLPGPSIEYHLLRTVTGVEWTEADFDQAAERVYAQERANHVRHWGRNRRMDESVLAIYETQENWTNPYLGQKYALDREQFAPLMDEYYARLGWDKRTGWPLEQRLTELGIGEVYEPMIAGARRSEATRPDWPEAVPLNREPMGLAQGS